MYEMKDSKFQFFTKYFEKLITILSFYPVSIIAFVVKYLFFCPYNCRNVIIESFKIKFLKLCHWFGKVVCNCNAYLSKFLD